MFKFYVTLWIYWLFRVVVTSTLFATAFSVLITAVLYIQQGTEPLTPEVQEALLTLFKFWFPITWGISLLLSLFLVLKYIFNSCYNGYKLQLLECTSKEAIDIISYGDLLRVWRKWFMVIVWIVGIQTILGIVFSNFFMNYASLFDWFNIYVLFIFILVAGFFSFMLLAGRCQKVRVVKC